MQFYTGFLFLLLAVIQYMPRTKAAVGLFAPNRYDGIPEECLLPMDFGYCRAKVKRYYFDMRRMKCAMFFWGGCAGNINNYKSMEECNRICLDAYTDAYDDRQNERVTEKIKNNNNNNYNTRSSNGGNIRGLNKNTNTNNNGNSNSDNQKASINSGSKSINGTLYAKSNNNSNNNSSTTNYINTNAGFSGSNNYNYNNNYKPIKYLPNTNGGAIKKIFTAHTDSTSAENVDDYEN